MVVSFNKRVLNYEMFTETTTLAANVSVSPHSCVVKNMTCARFPTKLNCSGIGVGHCGSE